MRIEIHSDVYDEIEAAKRWYENQVEGLGERFEQELDRAMLCIREFPDTWPKYTAGTRLKTNRIEPTKIDFKGFIFGIFQLLLTWFFRVSGYQRIKKPRG